MSFVQSIGQNWLPALRRRDAAVLTIELMKVRAEADRWSEKLETEHVEEADREKYEMRWQTGAKANPWNPHFETWTFPDKVEPDEAECVRRFRSLCKNYFWRKNDPVVWAFQRGGRKGRPHFHTVRGHRTDAKRMWDVSEAYGFGRYDVVPVENAQGLHYIAKYLSRPNSGLREHRQAWGAVCTPRVKLDDVTFDKLSLPEVAEVPAWILAAFRRASVLDDSFDQLKTLLARPAHETGVTYDRQCNQPHSGATQ